MNKRHVWWFVLVLACGGGGGAEEETAMASDDATGGDEVEAVDDASGPVIAAVQLLDEDDRGIVIDADGQLTVDGDPVGRWLADGTFEDLRERVRVRIDSDRIVSADGEELAHFDGDAVESEGTKLEFDAEGVLRLTERETMRLVPADSGARRIALASLLLARWLSAMHAL